MGQIDASRRYLERLKKRRYDPLYMQQAQWLIKRQAPEFQHIGQQYGQYLEREGAPETAKAQAVLEQQHQWAKTVSGAVEPARLREEEHRKRVEGQIEEAEFKIDIMEEQKKEQDEARERDFWKNLLKTGMGLAGTMVAGPLGALAGDLAYGTVAPGDTSEDLERRSERQEYWEDLVKGISPAVGGLTGSIIGESIYGSEYFAPAGIVQGMQDIALEIGTATELKSEEERSNLMTQILQSEYYKSLPKNIQYQTFFQMQTDLGILSPKAFVRKYQYLLGK